MNQNFHKHMDILDIPYFSKYYKTLKFGFLGNARITLEKGVYPVYIGTKDIAGNSPNRTQTRKA